MLNIKLLICITIICMFPLHSNQVKTIAIFDRFEICEKKENASMDLKITRLHYAKNIGTVIDATVHVYRDGFNIRFAANSTRCANRESLDTCERINDFNPANTCMFLTVDYMAWTPLFKNSVPPFKCPCKKGKYVLRNGSFEPDMFNFFPIDQFYWKSHFKFYDDRNLMFNICAEYKIVKAVN